MRRQLETHPAAPIIIYLKWRRMGEPADVRGSEGLTSSIVAILERRLDALEGRSGMSASSYNHRADEH